MTEETNCTSSQSTTRLGRMDWINAGFRALVAQGPAGLKVESTARLLSTTKGSFYWHFKDLSDWKQQMIATWEARAYHDVVAALSAAPAGAARLRALAVESSTPPDADVGGFAAEPALRAWALHDVTVAEAVARIDAARIAYVGDELRAAGRNPDWADMIYATYVGQTSLAPRLAAPTASRTPSPVEVLVELILGA